MGIFFQDDIFLAHYKDISFVEFAMGLYERFDYNMIDQEYMKLVKPIFQKWYALEKVSYRTKMEIKYILNTYRNKKECVIPKFV